MRDLSLRQVYSFLQSKMAHLAMNGLSLQGHGLFCLLLLPLSCSNSLKVIHCYYIPKAPNFFPPCSYSLHWNLKLLYSSFSLSAVLQGNFPSKYFHNTFVLHQSQDVLWITKVGKTGTWYIQVQHQVTWEIILICTVAIIRVFSLIYQFYFCLWSLFINIFFPC